MKFSVKYSWSLAVLTLLVGTAMTCLDSPEAAESGAEQATVGQIQATEVVAKNDSTSATGKNAETTGSATDADKSTTDEHLVQKAAVSSNACLSDPSVLEEIKKKHEEIDQKWKDVAAREAELKAREVALDEELKKLQATRDEITKLEDAHRQASEEKVAKVVETLEGMSPKASSQMLSTLDDGLAVMAINQMSTVKLSKIMNVMDTARASRLTELLAGVVRAKRSGSSSSMTASKDAAATTNVAASKGATTQKGENINDQQSEQIISSGSEPKSGQRLPASE